MPAPVTLHVYDVLADETMVRVNQYLQAIGTGAFHSGVEVYGLEWSYGFIEQGTGVFCCSPKGCRIHRYRESVPIGETDLTELEVEMLIENLKREWPGTEYDLLRCNCTTFSGELCMRLGVGHIPYWVNNLAAAGATVSDGIIKAVTVAEATAIIAAAKAGKIDEQYNIRGTATVAARDFLQAANSLDKRYRIRETAADVVADAADAASKAAAKTADAAAQAVAQAEELDKQYRIREQAADTAAQAAAQAGDAASKVSEHAEELDKQYGIRACAANITAQASDAAVKLAQHAEELDRQNRVTERAGLLLTRARASCDDTVNDLILCLRKRCS